MCARSGHSSINPRISPGGHMGKQKKIERMKEIDRRRKRREERLKVRIREAKAAAKSK